MSRVVVVGSFNVDHVWSAERLPAPGETLAGRYSSGPGGKGFNQATAAARSGAQTSFVCALGDDVGGQLARALAVADGIDLRDQRSDAPTGTAGIFVGADGRNSIVIGPGANAAIDPQFIAEQDAELRGAAVVLAQLESPVDAIAEALRRGRAGGALAMLNPAPANAPSTRELLALADVLTPNETEFCALSSAHAGVSLDASSLATLEDNALHAHCRGIAPRATVVITLGAAGCFVSHPADQLRGDTYAYYRIAAERVQPIDTTGAGDAFSGALAAAIALFPTRTFEQRVRSAGRYAALSTEHAGAATSMPRLDEVERRFGAIG